MWLLVQSAREKGCLFSAKDDGFFSAAIMEMSLRLKWQHVTSVSAMFTVGMEPLAATSRHHCRRIAWTLTFRRVHLPVPRIQPLFFGVANRCSFLSEVGVHLEAWLPDFTSKCGTSVSSLTPPCTLNSHNTFTTDPCARNRKCTRIARPNTATRATRATSQAGPGAFGYYPLLDRSGGGGAAGPKRSVAHEATIVWLPYRAAPPARGRSGAGAHAGRTRPRLA
jgi:hypothetical protein